MKVLMIGQLPKEVGGTYTNGVCNVVYELGKCSSNNIEFHIYGTNIVNDKAVKIPGNTRFYGTKYRYKHLVFNILKHPFNTIRQWTFYKQKNHMSPLRCECYKDNVIRIVNEVKPDIIHCMNVTQMAPIFFARGNKEIPIVLTLHGVFFDNNKDVEDLTRNNAKLADYVTGLTPETIEGIRQMGTSYSKTFMIPNGVDTNKFCYDDNMRISIRKEQGVGEDCTLLITVGSLQHRKGQLSFCKLLNEMPKSFKYKYLIIGTGPDKEIIEKYIDNHGLSNCVRVEGYVPNTDLYKYYSAADIYIHGSYEEGQSLSEVEAYAADMKIALNKDILGTVVTDTNNTDDYFVFSYDKFDYTNFIQWASVHKRNRKTRGKYNWQEIFNRYCEIYNQIKNEKDIKKVV